MPASVASMNNAQQEGGPHVDAVPRRTGPYIVDLYKLDRNSALACTFWIEVAGIKVRALLDSGALISVMKKAPYTSIIRSNQAKQLVGPLTPLAIQTYVRTAMGHTQRIEGCTVLPMRIGVERQSIDSDLYLQRFAILEELDYDVILGQDFLLNAGCRIDYTTGRVHVRAIDHTLQLFIPRYHHSPGSPPPELHLVVYNGPDVCLPPGAIHITGAMPSRPPH